jgi:predicted transcriptional regulator
MSKTAVNELSLNIRLSSALLGRLQRAAERESNNIAAVVRRLVSAGLEREDSRHAERPAGR